MRRFPRLLGCVLLLSTACATSPRVEVDRLEGVELAQHSTFVLSEALSHDDPAYGPSAREAARTALLGELRARGLDRVEDADAADLVVSLTVTSKSRIEAGDVFATPGHAHVVRRRSGVRTPVGDVPLREDHAVVHHGGSLHQGPSREVHERRVVLDFYDAETDRLVWRGQTRGPMGRKIDVEALRKRVKALAAEFP